MPHDLHLLTAGIFVALALTLGGITGIARHRGAPPAVGLALWSFVTLVASFGVGFGERARQQAPFEWLHVPILIAGAGALVGLLGVVRYLLSDRE